MAMRFRATGSAALEGIDSQVFTRDFLRKFMPNVEGLARVESADLTPGEQQLCLLMSAKGLAAIVQENGQLSYLLDQEVHEQLLESLVTRTLPLRASTRRRPAEA